MRLVSGLSEAVKTAAGAAAASGGLRRKLKAAQEQALCSNHGSSREARRTNLAAADEHDGETRHLLEKRAESSVAQSHLKHTKCITPAPSRALSTCALV